MIKNVLSPKTLLLTQDMFNDNDDFQSVCDALGVDVDFNDEGDSDILEIQCFVLNSRVEFIEEEDERHPSLTDSERNPSLGKTRY